MYYIPILDANAVSSYSQSLSENAGRWSDLMTVNPEIVSSFDAHSESGRLVFNVSGTKFETYSDTLNRFPNSVLGSPERRRRFWNESRGEYFVDRHRLVFQAILQCFQTGKLRKPMEVPEDIFIDEVRYYDLGKTLIDEFLTQEGIPRNIEPPLPKNKFNKVIWQLFEYPETSMAARVIGVLSIFMILVSVVVICMETLPQLEILKCINVTYLKPDGTLQKKISINRMNPFFIIESVCVAWFTIEYLLRIYSCPNKKEFLKNLMNIFDLAAILPFFILLISESVSESGATACGSLGSVHLRIVRLLRVTRVLKLTKHAAVLRVVGKTLHASLNELALFIFFIAVCTVLFSSAVYYAEHETNDQFKSIPHAFWWAVITLTTVGYGDIVPKTTAGKLVASCCVVLGLLGIAMPVPIIVTNFLKFYRLETGRNTMGPAGI